MELLVVYAKRLLPKQSIRCLKLTNIKTEAFLQTLSGSLHCVSFETVYLLKCHLSTFCITEGFTCILFVTVTVETLYMYKYAHQKLGSSVLSVCIMEVLVGGRK